MTKRTIEVTKIDETSWNVHYPEFGDDAIVWLYSANRYYCTACSSFTCEHVHPVFEYEQREKLRATT